MLLSPTYFALRHSRHLDVNVGMAAQSELDFLDRGLLYSEVCDTPDLTSAK